MSHTEACTIAHRMEDHLRELVVVQALEDEMTKNIESPLEQHQQSSRTLTQHSDTRHIPQPADTQETPDDLDRKAVQSLEEGSKSELVKRARWLPYTFGIVSACFSVGAYIAGVVMAVVHPAARIYHLQAWRWAFYIGSFFPVLWLDWLVSYGLKYLIEVRLLRHGMLAYFLTGTRKPIARLLAIIAATGLFSLLFAIRQTDDKNGRKAFSVVLRVHLCVVIAALGGVFTAFCTKIVATAFQKEAQLDSMRTALEQEFLLMQLAEVAMDMPEAHQSKTHQKRRRRKSVVMLSETFNITNESKPTKPLDKGRSRVLQSLTDVRALEKHLRKKGLGQSLADTLRQLEDGDTSANSETEARRLAVYLFWKLNPDPDREYLTKSDIAAFVDKSQVDVAFRMLDGDDDGKVSLSNMRDAIVAIFQRRSDLAATLKDTNTVVGELRNVLFVLVQLLLIFVYLVMFKVNIARSIVAYYSVIFVFLFVFGTSIRAAYDNAFFLFVIHPFDVGDLVSIGSDQYRVERLTLNSAVLVRDDGIRVWYPCNKLSNVPIDNISRSGPRGGSFKVLMDIGTHPSVFQSISNKLEQHFEEHRREFNGDAKVLITGGENPMKMEISIGFQYSHNGSDQKRMAFARHELFLTISECIAKLEAGYTMPTMGGAATPLVVAPETAATLIQQQPEVAGPPAFFGLRQRKHDKELE